MIPDQLQYVLLMAGCLLITLPLEFVLQARVYRRPMRMLQAVLITAISFSVWDIIAIQFDLWRYSPQFTSGIFLPFDYPLEELLFFIVIPLCGLLTYEAVGFVLRLLSKFWNARSEEKADA